MKQKIKVDWKLVIILICFLVTFIILLTPKVVIEVKDNRPRFPDEMDSVIQFVKGFRK